jgi:hypothetical protein
MKHWPAVIYSVMIRISSISRMDYTTLPMKLLCRIILHFKTTPYDLYKAFKSSIEVTYLSAGAYETIEHDLAVKQLFHTIKGGNNATIIHQLNSCLKSARGPAEIRLLSEMLDLYMQQENWYVYIHIYSLNRLLICTYTV